MAPIQWGVDREQDTGVVIDAKAAVAELIAMTLFVIVGCGTACSWGAASYGVVLIPFAFGMGILVLAYMIGHHSGGQINCAVTFSLALGGQIPWYQALVNVAAQFLGSALGAVVLSLIYQCEADATGNLGSNAVSTPRFGLGNALVAEFVCTFLLCYVVWETAVSPLSDVGRNAPIAIGFAVLVAHLVLLPIDGCSINPTRSFGPMVLAQIRACPDEASANKARDDFWVFFVGPLLGAAAATAVQLPMVKLASKDKE